MSNFNIGDVVQLRKDVPILRHHLIQRAKIIKIGGVPGTYFVEILEPDALGFHNKGIYEYRVNMSSSYYVKDDYGFKQDLEDLLNE